MELMRASALPKPVRQANLAWSRQGVIRALHYHERGQDDLSSACRGWCASSCSTARPARCSRRTSATTTRSRSTSPGTYAHGYEALTDCLFCYFVTEEYDAADPDEHGVPWNDPRVAHLWSTQTPILSARDLRRRSSPARAASSATRCSRRFPRRAALTRADWDVTFPPPPGLDADLVLHTAAWTNVDGAEDDPQSAAAVNVGGVQHAAELGAPLVVWSSDYVFDGQKRTPYVESDTPAPLSRVRPHEAARRGGRRRAGVDRAQLVALRLVVATTSSARCCGSARSATRWRSSTTSAARPTYVGHLAEATKAVLDLPYGIYHVAAAGDCTWAEFAEAIFEEAGLDDARAPHHHRGVRRAAPRGPRTRSCAARRGAPELPHWRDGPARSASLGLTRAGSTMESSSPAAPGFIGSHFARRLAAHGEEVVVLDKLTYAGNRANLDGVEHEFHQGDIADPEAVARAANGVDAIVNFAAETHVDRSILGPAEFILTDVLGTQVLLDHARHHGMRFVQVSTDEVYGDIALDAPAVHGGRAAARRRARTRRRRPAATCRCSRTSAPTASTRSSRAARTRTGRASTRRSSCRSSSRTRSTASRCRSTATGGSGASGCRSTTTARRSSSRCARARPARSTTSAARSARTSRSSGASST